MHNLPMECAAVFLISTQAALFGPSKYGLLPELVPEKKLSWGNGIIEFGTFLGSISAVMAAGFLAERFRGREAIAGVILLGCTLFGLATSFGISRVPAANPTKKFRWNPIGDFGVQMKTIVRGSHAFAGPYSATRISFSSRHCFNSRSSSTATMCFTLTMRTSAICRLRSRSASASAASLPAIYRAARSNMD